MAALPLPPPPPRWRWRRVSGRIFFKDIEKMHDFDRISVFTREKSLRLNESDGLVPIFLVQYSRGSEIWNIVFENHRGSGKFINHPVATAAR